MAVGQPGFSFPSSHSFVSGLIIIICLFFILPYPWVLISLALINAVNRLAIGVHYLADVIAGLSLGALAGTAWVITLRIAAVALP